MLSRKLDQFYTKQNIAKECYDLICNTINIFNYKLIEPSAGKGSFSDLFHENSIAIDLDPQKKNIIKQDFFDFEINSNNNIVIGNPPFGKNSSLAIKFFNKSAIFSKYICMILPKTFKKDSIINKLDFSFHLLKEINLPKNSFLFNDKDYDVPCVFQIWEKREIKREKKIQKNKTKYFDFVKKNEGEIAIRRVGGLAGKVIEDFEKYKEPSHYYIKINSNKEISLNDKNIFEILKKCYEKFNEKAKNTAGNPSLSKHELITIFEEEYLKNK
jgi:predicted RNA methylase